MEKYLHWLLSVLFFVLLLWQCIFWGGAAALPEAGPVIHRSAMREAPVVLALMAAGEGLAKPLPFLRDIGRRWADKAFSPAYERLNDNHDIAMDLIFTESLNSDQRLATRGFYALPVLLVMVVLAWLRRHRQVRLMGRKRR